MASAIHRTTLEYLPSAHTPNLDPAVWIINPDVSLLSSVSKKYWKINGDSVEEMSPAEKSAVDNDISNSQNVNSAGTLIFEKGGWARNKWLGIGSNKFSDKVPYVIPTNMTVTCLTFVNSVNSVEADVEIYKNGSKIYTWELRDRRWAWQSEGLFNLSFVPGDKLSIFLKDQGTNPKDVIITIHYRVTQHDIGQGGGSSL
jgi:hypothetical protein